MVLASDLEGARSTPYPTREYHTWMQRFTNRSLELCFLIMRHTDRDPPVRLCLTVTASPPVLLPSGRNTDTASQPGLSPPLACGYPLSLPCQSERLYSHTLPYISVLTFSHFRAFMHAPRTRLNVEKAIRLPTWRCILTLSAGSGAPGLLLARKSIILSSSARWSNAAKRLLAGHAFRQNPCRRESVPILCASAAAAEPGPSRCATTEDVLTM